MISTGLSTAVVSESSAGSGLLHRSVEQHWTFWYAQLLLFMVSQSAADTTPYTHTVVPTGTSPQLLSQVAE